MSAPTRGQVVASWWPWLGLPAAATALVTTGIVLDLATARDFGGQREAWVNAPLAIGFSTVAAAIWSVSPRGSLRRLGALCTVVGLGSAVVLPARAWAQVGAAGVPGELPGTAAAAWVSNWVWTLGAPPLLGLMILLYPDGLLPSRRWRPALALGTAAPVGLLLSSALRPGELEALSGTTNPVGIGSPRVWDVVGGVCFVALLASAVAGLAALLVKARAAPPGGVVRRQVGSFLLAAGLLVVVATLPEGGGLGQLVLTLAVAAAVPATIGAAVLRHRLLDEVVEVEELSRRLDDVAESRRSLVGEREEERLRLRRELHDGLGPSLAAIGLGLRHLERSLDGGAARTTSDLGDEVQRAVAEVRRICEGLRPDELNELGLEAALTAGARRLTAFGDAEVCLDVRRMPPLAPAVEVAAFRIAMEAITNAVRHAGARRIEVALVPVAGNGVRVSVRDDGRGVADDAPVGVGRRAMAERAEELGGWVRVTTPEVGTVVEAWLPALREPV